MHVIILCDFAVPTGGSQRVAIESARALAEAGVSVSFVHAVAGHDGQLDHPLIACISLDLPDVWDRPLASAAMSGVWNGQTRHLLEAKVLVKPRTEPTILHLHQWTRAFSPSVFAWALASDMPLVVTAHDYFLACPNGVYYRFERHQPCTLRPMSLGCLTAACDPKSSAHKAIRVARSFATAATISGKSFDVVHVSDRGRETLAPLLPKTLHHHRIDNPIDVSRKPPAVIATDARFAFVGRLTAEKGAIVAAEAARLAECPIVFIGEGPAEAYIRAANPAAEVLGWRSRDEVDRLLDGEIKAIVAPSLWYETGPLTVNEAAAAGVGAIASDRCGAAERVAHGSSGFVVAPEAETVAAAMRELVVSERAQDFGRAAYERYWGNPPTPKAHAESLISLYGEILARSHS